MINVTKPYLPPFEEYEEKIKKIWETNWLTNQGPLATELEIKLKEFLQIEQLHLVNNGTIALQLAIQALDLYGSEIITTPFSFVATTSTILWEHCTPIFVDIETDNFNIDPEKIEEKITPKTKAIMATHVFGYPCDVEAIEKIAKKHNLKVIYDAAHAFGNVYKGKSVLSYGDISTCSFHATKVFHTVEGGSVTTNNPELGKKLELLKKFGFDGFEKESFQYPGINGKNSEFHAAMGLVVFDHLEEIIEKRSRISNKYNQLLSGVIERPKEVEDFKYNHIYYPIIFSSEEELLTAFKALNEEQIYPRRYFYPSLNELPYVEPVSCPKSEDISKRIACLPLDSQLEETDVERISKILRLSLNK